MQRRRDNPHAPPPDPLDDFTPSSSTPPASFKYTAPSSLVHFPTPLSTVLASAPPSNFQFSVHISEPAVSTEVTNSNDLVFRS